MTSEASRTWARVASWLGAGLVLVACATDATSGAPETTGRSSSAVWVNGGFETGAAGAAPPAPWAVQTFVNRGITVQTPQTFAGLDLVAGGRPLTTEIAATNQPDPDLGVLASLRVCRYGNQCARVNFHSNNTYGNGRNVNILSQTMTVAAGDVDPSDMQIHVRFTVAPVLQNPAHPANEQPYYFVIVSDLTKATTLYSDFNLSGAAGLAWQKINGGTPNEIDYTNWQLVDVSGAGGAIAQGDQIQLQIIGGGCSLGGHFGEVYVDGVGAVLPGLNIQGTGPAQANAGSNITYALTYRNGSNAAETGVVIDFTTPPNTTFQAITPPAGATCVTPAVGAAGTIVCTFTGPVPAGASGGLSVTVNINAGTVGTIVAGNYQIGSIQENPLLGPPIYTVCGCTLDSQCPAADWCHESAPNDCDAKLTNGTAIPNDPGHTNPTLNGTCTPAAGAVVCVSGVCDTSDNKCGYANGDGPCTAGNGGVVCRSGACSTNGKCEPAGGCNVDADCAAADWCDESTHVCTLKVANGGAVPNDPAHMNPTLNGTCTAAAGAVACVSGVCDTSDNKCGYANGDGPCTPGSGGNGGVVCRSGACSVNGTCEPSGGCNVDADCAAADWCDESTHVCTPKVANGGAVPTDPAHMNPTLNGTCTAMAGALVCVSGVCDTADNECGYANGDGPCTVGTGGVVCRSGQCSNNGVCEPAGSCNVDADCSMGNWCDESTHVCTPTVANGGAVPTDPAHMNPTLNGTCTAPAGALTCTSGVCDTADSKCGYANGDGTCSAGDAGNGAVVCRSGVCDPDTKCGYANGDGPCTMGTGATVCRSGMCSTNGTCEPAGGCDVDADCSAGNWCDESTHTCTPKVANGGAVPNDPAHMNPTVNGTCTAAAGAIVCASGVCDTHDNKCGYANGDGPCTASDGGDGSPVCRSNVCATTGPNAGECEGCTVNSECPSGEVCTNDTCVTPTDGGAADSGTADSGSAGDSGSPSMDGSMSADTGPGEEDATADGSPSAEAGVDASDTGIIEGGGCSSAGVSRGAGDGAWLAGLSILGLLGVRRNKRRAA